MIIKRKCAACGEIKDRTEFIKITRAADTGEIVIAPDSKTVGRSAYLCKDENCIKTAFKKDRLFKVLKARKDSSLQERIEKFIDE